MTKFEKALKLDDCSLYFACHCAGVKHLPEILNTYKLFSITGGSGVVHTFDSRFNVKVGDAFLIFPNEIFGFNNLQEGMVEYNCIYFDVDDGKFSEMFESLDVDNIKNSVRVFNNKKINEAVKSVVCEIKEQKLIDGFYEFVTRAGDTLPDILFSATNFSQIPLSLQNIHICQSKLWYNKLVYNEICTEVYSNGKNIR